MDAWKSALQRKEGIDGGGVIRGSFGTRNEGGGRSKRGESGAKRAKRRNESD